MPQCPKGRNADGKLQEVYWGNFFTGCYERLFPLGSADVRDNLVNCRSELTFVEPRKDGIAHPYHEQG